MARLLFIASRGTNDPTAASLPFHLAVSGSVEAGLECALALTGDAAALIRDPVADSVVGVGLPPLRELVARLDARGIPIFVSSACAIARGASEADLDGKNARFVSPQDLVS